MATKDKLPSFEAIWDDSHATLAKPTQRERFELWAQENVGQPSFAGKHVRGGRWSYKHNIMQLCWQCWQEASK